MLHKSGGTRKLLAKVIPPLANFSVMRMKNLARGRGELLEVGYGLWRLSRGNVDVYVVPHGMVVVVLFKCHHLL